MNVFRQFRTVEPLKAICRPTRVSSLNYHHHQQPMAVRITNSFMTRSRFMSTETTASGGSYIHLPTRGLLQIHGKDASKFLQGLITNHMPRIENGGGGFLAAFLSPKVNNSSTRQIESQAAESAAPTWRPLPIN